MEMLGSKHPWLSLFKDGFKFKLAQILLSYVKIKKTVKPSMKKILISLIVAIQFLMPVAADTLSERDKVEIAALFDKVNQALATREPKVITETTFGPILAIMGGQEKYIERLENTFKDMDAQKLKLISYTNNIPDTAAKSKQYLICTIREVSILEKPGLKLQVNGFTLAVRKISGGEWKLIGGNGVSKNPKVLNFLFPGLDKNFEVPEYVSFNLDS